MRTATIATLPLVGALLTLPVRAPAQAPVSVVFGPRLGPEIGVFEYSPARDGEWRGNYRRWTPVTLYDVNGRYYRSEVRGARQVLVYSYDNDYFLPPRDKDWNGADARYNYRRQPTPADFGRARPPVPRGAVIDPRLGSEVGVLGYSPERAGDWHTNYRMWTPVTVYETQGRYYPNNSPGARPVGMYRYHEEHFLPPNLQAWVGWDKRFDYVHRPGKSDYARVRGGP